MLASRDLFQQIRQLIEQSHNARYYVCEGTVTSRSASPPSVKVMLQPMNIESGWLKIGSPYAGAGYGFIAVPPEGMTVKVIFDLGNINSPTVVCNVYNDEDAPPSLSNVDDVVLQHLSGSAITFSGNNVTIEAKGSLTLKGSTSTQTL